MSCTNPNYALLLGIVDGKKKLKFLPHRADFNIAAYEARYGKDYILQIPCGKCDSCKLDYSRSWATRCCLEASQYKFNWFVTLTYDNQHLPKSKKAARLDYQRFLKRLRKDYPAVKYFGCFELGSHTARPHHHMILFNLPLPDLKVVGKRRNGYLWKSKYLLDTWKYGLVDIGECTFKSCSYVSRYVMKKRGSDNGEFCYMSRNLGKQFILDHLDSITKYDKIFF